MRQIANRSRHALRRFAILAAGTLASTTPEGLLGQVPPAPDPTFQQIQPPSRTLPLPGLPSPTPQPQFRLPRLAPPGESRVPGGQRFFVRRIDLVGNTAFSTETLKREVAGAFENRILSG